MHSPAPEVGVGFPGGSAAEKESNAETTLSAFSPVDYMSITSFPRLPEDDANDADKSRKDSDNTLSQQDTDPDLFLKSARLQRLPSSASDLASHDVASLRETSSDPFTEDCACQRDGLTVIITACLTFATGVTVALIMQIYFGDPQIFRQGAVVTDAGPCTALAFRVLEKQGSSVDAAAAAALCLGIVHPHTSGIGGGGVMLVHDIRKNETRVIDFRETAPSGLREEMLQTNLQQNSGLLVAVPGFLSGIHQAHQLYGRLPWKDVVTMAAEVARNGFNVTHDLASALSEALNGSVTPAFRDLFLPNGQAPPPGLFTRRLDLAAILEAVAVNGVTEFYGGNLTQEMVAAAQARGGVLSEEDFGNYSTVLQQPAEISYQGHHVMSASAPHAGPALMSALNILEGFNVSSVVPRNSSSHWTAEALKISLALASGLGDPEYDSAVTPAVDNMLSKSQAWTFRQMISDSQAFPVSHYTPTFNLETSSAAAAQVMVMGPDDLIVSTISSLNRPFGSGIVTPSGILLNSQILDFSWSNKTAGSAPNPRNRVQPGKRPQSFLLPTAVRPAVGLCGTYVAVGSSNGDKALSAVTQVLMNVLSSRKNMSDSLALGRLHPQLEPNTLLVDAEFPDEDVAWLQVRGHTVERRAVLSLVEGTRRTNDLIIGVKDPRSADASAITMSNAP